MYMSKILPDCAEENKTNYDNQVSLIQFLILIFIAILIDKFNYTGINYKIEHLYNGCQKYLFIFYFVGLVLETLK